jgi:hypothetical protein
MEVLHMNNYSTLGHHLKRGIFNFCGKLSKGLKKPIQKFITDMTYGILASKSSYLTEMARSLNEDIALDKTVERLSRNLMNMDNTDEIIENYFNTIKPNFDKQTILILDDSDVSKPYSSKLYCFPIKKLSASSLLVWLSLLAPILRHKIGRAKRKWTTFTNFLIGWACGAQSAPARPVQKNGGFPFF